VPADVAKAARDTLVARLIPKGASMMMLGVCRRFAEETLS
jgi:hypothetical protein